MNQIKRYFLGLVATLFMAIPVHAQDAPPNSLESIAVAQQGATLNVRMTFRDALTAVPPNFSVANPARIAFDLLNTTNGLGENSQTYNEGDLRSVNIAQAAGKTRVVLNLLKMAAYESHLDGNNLIVSLTPNPGNETTGGVVSKVEHFSQAPSLLTSNIIRDIAFRRGKDGEGRIIVNLSDPNAGIDIRQHGKELSAIFLKTSVPDSLRKRLDVTDFATPVVSVDTLQDGANARIKINSHGLWEHNAYQSDGQFVIEVRKVIVDPNKLVQGTRGGYQGEKLSLNFQNVEVRRLLQVIGEFTGMNIVVSDSVSGSITLILKDVPWDQALDIILKQKDLDMRKNGNVILVAPREEFAAKEKLAYEARAQIDDLEPLVTETFTMNYVKGEELRKLMIDPKQTMLSKRGSVLLDSRSNIMIIKDTQKRIEDIRTMLAQIDIPLRQVMIEARIVEAGDSFAKNLGIRLSMGAVEVETKKDSNTNLLTYTYKPTSEKSFIANNYTGHKGSVNLPATPRASNAGSYALTLFNRGMSRFISAEISALEADGKGKIISSPRVMTSNQNEALIEQGVEIPYQEASSSGATSVSFKKANLSLKVKPQITPDGKVAMILDINKDTPNTSLSTGSGVAIDTKHVKTEVLVDNGGTVVIGGIYTQTTSSSTNRIPLLGDLPYIGWLFKNREWIDDKTELLVFITPRIMAEGLSIR